MFAFIHVGWFGCLSLSTLTGLVVIHVGWFGCSSLSILAGFVVVLFPPLDLSI